MILIDNDDYDVSDDELLCRRLRKIMMIIIYVCVDYQFLSSY
jgi:hypothetical protein